MADDTRGTDPAEYDLSPRQLRELAGQEFTPRDLRRREVNNRAAKARAASKREAKAKRDVAAHDALRYRRLAHNPLGPDDPASIYWRTRDGATFVEPKPTAKLALVLLAEDMLELEALASRRGETPASYGARVLAGHARGLRNARRAPKPVPALTPGQEALI